MSPIDPFGPTPDPAGYVPRPATERALEALQAALADGAVAVALRGPSGIGKTLLLHVLAARNASARRVAYVRYPQMAAEDQCRWVLATLGEATDGDPSEALLAAARSGAGLVLLCDEADHFPEAAAEALLDLARGSGGAIQLVLVAGEAAAEAEEDAENAETDEEWPAPWRGGAAAGPVVWLREPMDGDETAAYVAARLERAGADEATRARFHPAVLRAMAERSGGLPSALHAEAERELGSPGTRSASVEDVAAGAAAARARREAQAADRERWRAAVSTALERSGRAERPRRVRPKGAGRRGGEPTLGGRLLGRGERHRSAPRDDVVAAGGVQPAESGTRTGARLGEASRAAVASMGAGARAGVGAVTGGARAAAGAVTGGARAATGAVTGSARAAAGAVGGGFRAAAASLARFARTMAAACSRLVRSFVALLAAAARGIGAGARAAARAVQRTALALAAGARAGVRALVGAVQRSGRAVARAARQAVTGALALLRHPVASGWLAPAFLLGGLLAFGAGRLSMAPVPSVRSLPDVAAAPSTEPMAPTYRTATVEPAASAPVAGRAPTLESAVAVDVAREPQRPSAASRLEEAEAPPAPSLAERVAAAPPPEPAPEPAVAAPVPVTVAAPPPEPEPEFVAAAPSPEPIVAAPPPAPEPVAVAPPPEPEPERVAAAAAPPEPAVAVPAPPEPEPATEAAAAEAPAEPTRIAAVPPPIAVEPRVVTVSINARPWAVIEVDGVEVGETPLGNLPLAVGRHRIVARMADGRVLERTVEVTEDDRFIGFR